MKLSAEDIVVRLLELNKKTSGHPPYLTKTYIHKVLYLLHRKSGLDLLDCLPYYWYKYGPFSERVDSAITSAVDRKKLQEIRPSAGFEAYRLLSGPRKPLPAPVEVSLASLLRLWNPFHMDGLIRHVYEKCAPWPFYPAYKLDFLDKVADMVGEKGEDSTGTLEQYFGPMPDAGLKVFIAGLMRAEGALPPEPEFEHFNAVFLGFSGATARLMAAVMAGKLARTEMRDVHRTGTDIWDTFSRGARTVPKGREPGYDDQVARWNDDYQSRLSHLDEQVHHYLAHADEILGPGLEPGKYRSPAMMAAVLAPYLK